MWINILLTFNEHFSSVIANFHCEFRNKTKLKINTINCKSWNKIFDRMLCSVAFYLPKPEKFLIEHCSLVNQHQYKSHSFVMKINIFAFTFEKDCVFCFINENKHFLQH